MNLAIVGFGTAGKYYLEILKNNKKIKNIFVIEEKKLVKDNSFNLIFLKDIKNKKIKIDHAIISTPSNLHFKFAKFFIMNKSNVLIEKPFVLRLNDAKKLIELSNKNKVKCWIAYQNRHNLALTKLKKIVKKNTLGKVNFVDSKLLWHRNFEYYKSEWRGKYKSDGGVLANQAIHLLDAIIYIFGPVINFNVMADYNKKKLQAEDLISINFKHKNNVISSLKATTRADKDYSAAIDVIAEKGRIVIKGISLNTFNFFKKGNLINDKRNSENFKLGLGPVSGMGTGHKKILKEFLSKKIKKSSKNLEVASNYYLLKLIHSIYSVINTRNFLYSVKNKQSIWGK